MPKMVNVNGVRVRDTDAKRFKVDLEKAKTAHTPGAVKPKPGTRNRIAASDPRIEQLTEALETVTAEVADLRAIVETLQGNDDGATGKGGTEDTGKAEEPADNKPKSRSGAGKSAAK